MRLFLPLFVLACIQGIGCNAGSTTPETPPAMATAAGPLAPVSFDPQDDPRGGDIVMREMGPLNGKVVADMFAGDGYYTWKLLSAGARVLAIDDDPAAIERLQAWKASQGIGDDRLLIRLTTPGVPGLLPDEADIALITREYSTLGDRQSWITQLMAGIKSPHLFYLVNYLPGQSPDGPPLSQRMDYNQVSEELTLFGADDVGISYKKLPYRYILFASKPPLMPEEEAGPGGDAGH